MKKLILLFSVIALVITSCSLPVEEQTPVTDSSAAAEAPVTPEVPAEAPTGTTDSSTAK